MEISTDCEVQNRFCFSDDSAEASAGSSAAKGPLPAPRLKRAPSEQERESTSSNPAAPSSPQHGSYLCSTCQCVVFNIIRQLTTTHSDSSEKLFWFLLCSAAELPADGDVFKPPSPATDPSVGGRQWSSLKSSASPAAAETEDSRERAKSLPAHGAIFKYYIHDMLQCDGNKQQEMQEMQFM